MPKKKPDDESTVRPALGDDDARVWLRGNGYGDIADQIESVMQRWRAEGKRTRRNWWEILAGHIDGQPRVAGGVTFPVLHAARRRQGLPNVATALCRSPSEQAPPVRVSARWPKSGENGAARVGRDERDTIRRIRQGVRSGAIPRQFRAADVNRVLKIHWAGNFLAKHRVGNPGGTNTELFMQIQRGLYRLK